MDRCLILDTAELLTAILQGSAGKNAEGDIVSALHQDSFLLGDQARNTTLSVLGRCAERLMTSTDLTCFLHEFWELHQAEDVDALPNSDSLAQFLRRYST